MSDGPKITSSVCATVVFLSSISLATQVIAEQEVSDGKSYELTATATLASDYVFRGVSQTLEDPAVHAGFDFTHDSGAFAGVWSSNVDFQERGPLDDQADQEVDIYVGYGINLNDDWSADATAIRYIYPGTASDADLDYNELLLVLHFRDYYSLLIGYSNEVFNIDGRGLYYGASGNWPIAQNMRITASVGYYDLDDALNDSYTDWSLGAEIDMDIFTARLAYIDTGSAAGDIFNDDLADARLVFSMTAALGK